MGTLEPRSVVAVPDPRPHEPVAEGDPLSNRPAVSRRDGETDRVSAEAVLERILVELGPGRITRAAVAQAIMLEPRDRQDGEQVARELGLDQAVDHTRPGRECTVWSGTHRGVEVQVRVSLRGAAGSDQ